ncbi:MAG: F0F1 ATP synthase subunit beta, partial [Alphaproteobacteria bacterium]|nr:F0F1 ATP synthase subunit beta [Alphaproteobacteria bacterium]
MPAEPSLPSTGRVLAVRGAVVDVAFDQAPQGGNLPKGGDLPKVDEALVVEWDRPEPLMVEVQAHLDAATVRGVALQATAGLKRGTPVRPTGAPVSVPVGEALLGRLLDVTGRVRDAGPALPADLPLVSIHRPAPPLGRRSAATAMFETGIKVIDLLAPLPQGGKAAMFG